MQPIIVERIENRTSPLPEKGAHPALLKTVLFEIRDTYAAGIPKICLKQWNPSNLRRSAFSGQVVDKLYTNLSQQELLDEIGVRMVSLFSFVGRRYFEAIFHITFFLHNALRRDMTVMIRVRAGRHGLCIDLT